MAEKTLSNLLGRFLILYLFLPILGLSLGMIGYAGWQRLDGLRFQKRITVKNAATAIEANLESLARDLQRSALLLREKDHWQQLDLLNYLNYRTSFDRLLLLSRRGKISYALNDSDRRLPELTSIFGERQLQSRSEVQISKPYALQGPDDNRLALVTATQAGELLIGEVALRRVLSTLTRFISAENEFVFLVGAEDRLLAPISGKTGKKAGSLIDALPETTSGAAESRLLFSKNTILSSWHIQGSNLTVALATPLNSPLIAFTSYLGLLIVAVLLIILSVTGLLFRRMEQEIIHPVRSLRQSVSKLKHGEYPVLNDSSPSSLKLKELDDLEFDFKSMIQILALREASLRQKSSEQQLLLDNVPLQIWFMIDPETQGVINEARARFFDLPSAETDYKNIKEVLGPEVAAREIEANRSVFRDKHTLQFEAWLQNADGEPRLLSIRKVPKLNDQGDVEFVVCTAQDKTENWHYEQKLRELSTAVEQSPASIIITDKSGAIQYVNPSFCRLSGYAEEEVLGRSPGLLKSGDKPEEEYAKLWKTIAEGRTWQGEFRNRARSGDFYWVSALISPIFDHNGTISHFVAFQEDITAKKEIENELLRAKIQAESANEAKSQFLANISHEIRTPLNGIIGMCSLLLDSQLAREERVYAETISNSANSLLEIINQILDFSKIESGALELEHIVFDLQRIIHQVLGLFTSQAMDKGLQLDHTLEPGVPQTLVGDPVRLQQVLMNLLGNGVKFTESGSVKLSVSPQFEDGNAVMLKFEIHDTGPGIPEDKRQTIFEPFIQADGSTTRKYGGTGLGLSICKQLVEMMGGQMGVDTQTGCGAKFWFTIRFRAVKQSAHPLPPHGGELPESPPTSLAEAPGLYKSWSGFANGVFDLDHLLDKIGHDSETLTAVLSSFIDDIQQRLGAVQEGLQAEDLAKIETEAFKIKGSSANIGAQELSRTASDLEEASADGDLDKAEQLIDTFHSEFQMFQWASQCLVASCPDSAPPKGRQ